MRVKDREHEPSARVGKRAQSAAETREAILEAACRVIAETGFERIRMRMMGEAAGVSIAALHYHFETRENLFAEALRYSFEDTGADVYRSWEGVTRQPLASPGSCPRRFRRVRVKREWAMWMELWCRAVRDTESNTRCVELYRQHHGWIEDTLRDGFSTGEFNDCDPRAHAQLDPGPTVHPELVDLIPSYRRGWIAEADREDGGVQSRAFDHGVFPAKDAWVFEFDERYRRERDGD